MTKTELLKLIEERVIHLIAHKEDDFDEDINRLKLIVLKSGNFEDPEEVLKLDLDELFYLILKAEDKKLYDYAKKNIFTKYPNFFKDGNEMFTASEVAISQLCYKRFLIQHKDEEYNLEDVNIKIEEIKPFLGKTIILPYTNFNKLGQVSEETIAEQVTLFTRLNLINKSQPLASILCASLGLWIGAYIQNKNNLIDLGRNCPIEYVEKEAKSSAKEIFLAEKKKLHMDFLLNKFYELCYIVNEGELLKTEGRKKIVEEYAAFMSNFDQIFKADEITNFKELTEYFEEDIKKAVLAYINEHNQKAYEELTKRETELSNNKDAVYANLLKEYGIIPDQQQLEEIKKRDIETVRKLLDKLAEIRLKDETAMLKILQTGDIENIESSIKYIKRGIISLSFLQENPEFFTKNSTAYNTVITNINNLINNSINLSYFAPHQEVLLMDSAKVEENLKVLAHYNLSRYINPEIDSNFLESEDLKELLDSIIELGFESLLTSDLNVINATSKKWKKVEVLQQIGYPVTREEIETILHTNQFFVTEDEMDDYLYKPIKIKTDNTTSDLNHPYLLHMYSATPLAYNINGIIISKNKVARIYSTLKENDMPENERLYISIVANKCISNDELEMIARELGVETDKILAKK